MRARLRVLALVGVLVGTLPGSAHADWLLAPFLGLTFKGDTTLLDHDQAAGNVHWNVGGAVTVVGDGPIGVEGLVVYTPGFFQQDPPPIDDDLVVDSRSLAVMGNVVLTTPRNWNEYGLRPFISGGIGLLSASSSAAEALADVLPVKAKLLGYNVGGGAVGFLTERTGLRFDLRYFSNLKPTDDTENAIGRVRLSYWTGTVGVVFRY